MWVKKSLMFLSSNIVYYQFFMDIKNISVRIRNLNIIKLLSHERFWLIRNRKMFWMNTKLDKSINSLTGDDLSIWLHYKHFIKLGQKIDVYRLVGSGCNKNYKCTKVQNQEFSMINCNHCYFYSLYYSGFFI